jgi:hypothetical protein
MGTSDPTTRVRLELRRTWLIWSVLPLAAFLVALVLSTVAYASQPVLSQKRAEDSFYTFLAISALVFLFAFTIDGYWTNPRRVAEAIVKRLNLGLPPANTGPESPAPELAASPQERATVAHDVVVGSASSLAFMGHAIGLAGILCLVAGAGPVHAYLLVSVAVSYQLYLFSRHPYYERVVEAAHNGELRTEEEDEKGKKAKKDNRTR